MPQAEEPPGSGSGQLQRSVVGGRLRQAMLTQQSQSIALPGLCPMLGRAQRINRQKTDGNMPPSPGRLSRFICLIWVSVD